MTLPTFLLAVALSTALGAAFHAWQGGDGRRLAMLLIASWLGFALGHVTGDVIGVHALQVGALNVLMAALGSALALGLTRLLIHDDVRGESRRARNRTTPPE